MAQWTSNSHRCKKTSDLDLARLDFSTISRGVTAVGHALGTFTFGYILDGAIVGQHWRRVFFLRRLWRRHMFLRLLVHHRIVEQILCLVEQGPGPLASLAKLGVQGVRAHIPQIISTCRPVLPRRTSAASPTPIKTGPATRKHGFLLIGVSLAGDNGPGGPHNNPKRETSLEMTYQMWLFSSRRN
jgi:hypothetical protein